MKSSRLIGFYTAGLLELFRNTLAPGVLNEPTPPTLYQDKGHEAACVQAHSAYLHVLGTATALHDEMMGFAFQRRPVSADDVRSKIETFEASLRVHGLHPENTEDGLNSAWSAEERGIHRTVTGALMSLLHTQFPPPSGEGVR